MERGPLRITDEVFQVGEPQLTAPQVRRLLSNAVDYQASLQRLIDLDAHVLCEGFRGKQDIVRFVRSFMR